MLMPAHGCAYHIATPAISRTLAEVILLAIDPSMDLIINDGMGALCYPEFL